ncbi:MAG: GAF and ANTAR domain-containing protein [Actinomycetota bacterium]|nr:GAF and ANTAR domain-containing protein [Actinomycetota bacterium]
MPGDRRTRIIDQLFPRTRTELGSTQLCEVCAEVTGMTGAGIMLISGDVSQGSAGSSDDVSAQIEELQFTLGEGPCVDAYRSDAPVLEPDLADPVEHRWLGFSDAALKAGARAVFGFPLHVGALRFGALNLYRDRTGPLGPEQHADALVMADVAAEALLLMQANAPPGTLATELATEENTRSVVHQAAGMMSAQLEVGVAQALVRLRAYAFSHERRLVDVARSVVDRRLRFSDEHDELEEADEDDSSQ